MNASAIKTFIADSVRVGGELHIDRYDNLTEDDWLRLFGVPPAHVNAVPGIWVPIDRDSYDATAAHTLCKEPVALGVNFPDPDLLVVAGFNGDCQCVWGFTRARAA